MRFSLCICAAMAANASVALAQQPDSSSRALQWKGEFGTYAEAYGISGREARRPDETGRVFLNSTVTLFGKMAVDVDMLLTTENGSAAGFGGLPGRQRLNQIGVNPRWSWGRAHLGSFSNSYTPYTFSGIRVTGVGLDLQPGPLRFGVFGGRARQASFGGATTGSYSRAIVGGRIGIGADVQGPSRGSFLDLLVLHAQDDVSSLPPPDSVTGPFLPDSLANQPDTALLPPIAVNPYAATPQENFVTGLSGGLSLMSGHIVWRGELDGSIHTRDRRAEPLAEDALVNYPGFLHDVVRPRVGTHADYAYRTELQFRVDKLPGATARSPRRMIATIGYRHVGPGYVSLGTSFLPNDQRAIEATTAFRFRRWSLNLDGMHQNDNLIGQKQETTARQRFGGSITVQPASHWSSSLRATRVGMSNESLDTLRLIDYSAWMIGTTQSLYFSRTSRVRNVSLSYTMQRVGDENPARSSSSLDSDGGNFNVAIALAKNVTVTPSLGLVRSSVGGAPAATRTTYGLATDWRVRDGKWSTRAALSRAQLSRTDALTAHISSRLRITDSDQCSLIIRASRYRNLVDPARNFDEHTASLQWSHTL